MAEKFFHCYFTDFEHGPMKTDLSSKATKLHVNISHVLTDVMWYQNLVYCYSGQF